MEIVERRENALLKRAEIEFIIRHENQPTPTRKAMTEWLNKLEPGSKKELVVIKDVTTRFDEPKLPVSVSFTKTHKLYRSNLSTFITNFLL